MTPETEPDWTDRVPGWLPVARKLSFLAVAVGLLLTVAGLSTGRRFVIGAGMAVLSAPLLLMGLVDLLAPTWGHHAGFRRYQEPTADPPTEDERRSMRRNGALVVALAVALLAGFLSLLGAA